MAESESQKRYNKKYQKEHKVQQDYYRGKSATKKFISRQSKLKDIKWIKRLTKQRRDNLLK